MTEGYSALVLELFRRPINRRRVDGANAMAEGANPLCGDRIRMEFVVHEGRIVDAGFTGDACAICIAAASLSTTAAMAKSVAEVMKMQDEHMLDLLRGQVPRARRRCATLPVDTMQRALLGFVQTSVVRPIILAAGAGRRFGGDKLVAIVDGEPMIHGVVRSYVALAGRATVVISADSNVTSALADLPVDLVVNPNADEGIASSIRAGVASCVDQPAVMIALADEPRVNRALAAEVMKRWQETGAPVVAARFNGEIGHPVIFDHSCFEDLLALGGDVGGRRLIREMGNRVQYIDVTEPHPADVDTPDDLDRF